MGAMLTDQGQEAGPPSFGSVPPLHALVVRLPSTALCTPGRCLPPFSLTWASWTFGKETSSSDSLFFGPPTQEVAFGSWPRRQEVGSFSQIPTRGGSNWFPVFQQNHNGRTLKGRTHPDRCLGRFLARSCVEWSLSLVICLFVHPERHCGRGLGFPAGC